MAETENNRWAKGTSRAKYMVRHYGRNYSVITEQSECGRLRFYATIESLYGANRFTETVRKRNGNFSMTPTVGVLCVIDKQQKIQQYQVPLISLRSPFNVLYSVLVRYLL